MLVRCKGAGRQSGVEPAGIAARLLALVSTGPSTACRATPTCLLPVQVSETQLELKEQCAEWEIAVHVLREDNAALSAKLRKAMVSNQIQGVL